MLIVQITSQAQLYKQLLVFLYGSHDNLFLPSTSCYHFSTFAVNCHLAVIFFCFFHITHKYVLSRKLLTSISCPQCFLNVFQNKIMNFHLRPKSKLSLLFLSNPVDAVTIHLNVIPTQWGSSDWVLLKPLEQHDWSIICALSCLWPPQCGDISNVEWRWKVHYNTMHAQEHLIRLWWGKLLKVPEKGDLYLHLARQLTEPLQYWVLRVMYLLQFVGIDTWNQR